MTNETLAERAGCSEATVSRMISKLKELGYIKIISFNGRVRKMTSLYDNPVPPTQNDKAAYAKTTRLPTQNDPQDNNIENIEKTGITNVIGETPEKYGNSEINELFDYWRMTVGYEIQAKTQRNRYACSNLLKKHGIENLKRLIQGVALSQQDKYAPRISDFITLQSKYNELIAWGKTNATTKRGVSL